MYKLQTNRAGPIAHKLLPGGDFPDQAQMWFPNNHAAILSSTIAQCTGLLTAYNQAPVGLLRDLQELLFQFLSSYER